MFISTFTLDMIKQINNTFEFSPLNAMYITQENSKSSMVTKDKPYVTINTFSDVTVITIRSQIVL